MNDTNVTVRCFNDLHIPLKTFIEPQKPLYCVLQHVTLSQEWCEIKCVVLGHKVTGKRGGGLENGLGE